MSGWNPSGMAGKIKAAQARGRAGAVQGLTLATEHVLQVSRTRVPIEEGTLERSGTASVDEANLTGYVSYDTPYAVVQHEDMTLSHDAGRSAKFLETALHGEAAVCRALIGRSVKGEMGGA